MAGGRSTREVLESHLRLRLDGDLERDLAENYRADVLLLSAEGVNRGHDGVRKLAEILASHVPEPQRYRYDDLVLADDIGMLAWWATSADDEIEHGADTFVVHEGQIVVQTVHYVTRRHLHGRDGGADEERAT